MTDMDLDATIGDIDEALAQWGADVPERHGPIVGGRWTLYDSELPITALGGSCAVTGISVEPGRRFVDIGFGVDNDTPNGDVCLAEVYVAELGRAIGMVSGEEHEAALRELEELRAEVEFLRQSAEEQAVDTGTDLGDVKASLERIEAAGTRIETELSRRKGGRPSKTTNKEKQGT